MNVKFYKRFFKTESKKLFLATFGSLLFALGVNMFIVPAGLYSGGFLGIGQLVRSFVMYVFDLNLDGIDLAGIVLYILDIPLFFLAYRGIGKIFFLRTLIVVSIQSVFLTFIPTNILILKGDLLASAIIGGVISGVGTGIVLREGASGGGQDILGVYMMKKNNNYSVGKISILINTVVFGICLWVYDVSTVIYSVIFLLVSSFITDRVHLQNINMAGIIITSHPEAIKKLIEEFERSSTIIEGTKSFTGDSCKIIYTVLSKYEARLLENRLKKVDPQSFSVFSEISHILGNYDKHL